MFEWKFGNRDMKEFFDERKNTVRYLDIRRDLETQEKRLQTETPKRYAGKIDQGIGRTTHLVGYHSNLDPMLYRTLFS